MEVVLLDDVRGGAVDERGEEGRGAPARGQDLARPFGWSHRLCESLEDADRPRVLAGQGRRDPVEEQFLRALDDFFRQVVEAESGEERGQLAGRRGPGQAHSSPPGVILAIFGA